MKAGVQRRWILWIHASELLEPVERTAVHPELRHRLGESLERRRVFRVDSKRRLITICGVVHSPLTKERKPEIVGRRNGALERERLPEGSLGLSEPSQFETSQPLVVERLVAHWANRQSTPESHVCRKEILDT